MGTLPVVYNVANFAKPAPGEPALISYDDVRTMFHEFGHALHGMFSNVKYPSLSGTQMPRDFVEFPSQFNEHWATDPTVFAHYAQALQDGRADAGGAGGEDREGADVQPGLRAHGVLAAALLDMRGTRCRHERPEGRRRVRGGGAREDARGFALVPPRYRTSYFPHIWGGGYSAGYYAYLWSEMLDDDAYQWFEEHGGLTRANGERFREMVLSRGNTEDLETVYERWRGGKPSIQPFLRQRGLAAPGATTSGARDSARRRRPARGGGPVGGRFFRLLARVGLRSSLRG